MQLSESSLISPIDLDNGSGGEPFLHDIGGTNAQSGFEDASSYGRGQAYVELGTWNASDDLDESKIQDSVDGSTANAEVTTDASGGNYDTDAPIDADGDFILTEFRAEDLATSVTISSSAFYARYYVGEGGNTGVDNACGYMLLYEYQYPRAQLQGAASSGSQVYVTPNS